LLLFPNFTAAVPYILPYFHQFIHRKATPSTTSAILPKCSTGQVGFYGL